MIIPFLDSSNSQVDKCTSPYQLIVYLLDVDVLLAVPEVPLLPN
jgi:hypothetical protein